MATPGQMVKKVSETLGVPEATVTVYDRALAEAGYRSKGGRGRSAAKMTAVDVANLLIAVAGTSVAKDAVQAVAEYSCLPSRDAEVNARIDNQSYQSNGNAPSYWNLKAFPITSLQCLPPNHSFRDALVALILSAADGSLEKTIHSLNSSEDNIYGFPENWQIHVVIRGIHAQATIAIFCKDAIEKHHYSNIPTDINQIIEWSHKNKSKSGDLKQYCEFTSATIMSMGKLLNT